jgi:phosphoglycerol transferase
VLRRLGLSHLSSGIAALLYSLLTVHFLRGEGHLFLSVYWTVPPLVYLLIRIMNGADTRPFRMLRWAIPVSILTGAAGFYYCFFSLMFLSLAAVYAFFTPPGKRYAAIAGISIAVSLATVLACLGPMIASGIENGPNPQVGKRDAVETEQYGLKIADLFLPNPQHRLLTLRHITAVYHAPQPWLHDNESRSVSLGVVGSAGCLILLVCAVAEFRRRPLLLHQLGILSVAGILFATTSGFGALFSLFVTPEIRAQNRVSIFLAFFSLIAVAFCLDALFRRARPGHRPWLRAACVLLLLAAVYDQTPAGLVELPLRSAADTQNMRAFVSAIERQLPPGSMVLQLPFVAYPEMSLRKIDAYDPLRAYLFSSTLRWSFPTMRFRAGDAWLATLSSLPLPELLPEALAAGYRGLYIDRFGYDDGGAALEAQLRTALQSVPLESPDHRLFFFNLTRIPDNWTRAAEQTRLLVPVWYRSGFYVEEHGPGPDPNSEWRWCSPRGTMVLYNLRSHIESVLVSLQALSGVPRPSLLTLHTNAFSRQFPIGAAPAPISLPLTLAPGETEIEFSTNAPRVPMPGDPRDLRFRIEHVTVTEVEPSA